MILDLYCLTVQILTIMNAVKNNLIISAINLGNGRVKLVRPYRKRMSFQPKSIFPSVC